ncbi:MAG: hypothetical protein KDC48_17155 [Planctomycetes bacterium]|nr:hypothetical protein [Planctomycetota bacterium]
MTICTRRFAHTLFPALFAGLIGMVTAGPALAQKPAPASANKKDPDPEVAKQIDLLKDAANDKKLAREKEAVDAINVLFKKHEDGLNEKDDKAIVKVLDEVLNKGKNHRTGKQIEVYTAASAALGYHGEDGAKALRKCYDGSRFPKKVEWVPLRERLLLDVGKTKQESMVKFLLDEATRNPEAALQAAAGEALGHFEEAKEELRKEIVDVLLVRYGSMTEKASQIGGSVEAQNAQDRLAALSGKWNETLKKLTRQNFDSFADWQSWHNKNKNKPW